MIQEGTDVKFKVTAVINGFIMAEDPFIIVVKNQWGQVKYTVNKYNTLHDAEGNFYFALPAMARGEYTASLTALIEDEDFPDGVRRMVDVRWLVTIGSEDKSVRHDKTDGADVKYERVWIVSVEGDVYLTDEDGNALLDKDGQRIYLTRTDQDQSTKVRLSLTGNEFKQLVEGRNQNGKIDTLPEAFDTLSGIDEDTEVTISTQEDIDEMMSRVLGKI